MLDLLQNPEVQRLLLLNEDGLLFAIWETIYVTVLSTLFSYLIGLPLGVLVVVGEKDGVLPLPKPLMSVINVVINLLRSVPFLILMVLVIPLSRVVLGTSIGTVATIIPLIEVTAGLASGALDRKKAKTNGAGAMSAKLSPVAMLILQNGTTRLVNVKNQDVMTKLLDMIPDAVDRFTGGQRVSRAAETAAETMAETAEAVYTEAGREAEESK